MTRSLLVLVSTAWLGLASVAGAQTGGGIAGTVRDAQGLPVPGVTVTLNGPQTQVATTDQQGTYRIAPLPPGTYLVRFELAGFRTLDRTDVRVAGTETTTLDATLEIALMESVTVTAQKREEDLQQVPIAITALTAQTIERAGIIDMSRLQFTAPGINVGRAGEDIRPAIRGARTEQVGAVNDPAVGFHVDGIYKNRPSQATNAFVDVERVEVQRGPQGTLFGRNTFGGNVHLISKVPASLFDAGADVTLGDFARRKVEGFVNVPLGNRVQFRVAGSFERRDGYIKNSGTAPDLWDENLNYVRGTLRIAPTNNFEILLRGTHWDQSGNGQGDFGYASLGTVRNAAGYIDLSGTRDPVSPRRGTFGASLDQPWDLSRDIEFTRDNWEDVGSAEVTWRSRLLTAKSLTAYGKFRSYRRNDGDYSSNVHAVEFTEEYTNPFSQEFQVGSGLGAKRFNWVAGLFYLTDNLDYRFAFNRMYLDIPNPKGSEYASIPTNVPNPNGLSSTLEMVDLTSRALFGQATLEVLPNLRATAGARYTKDTKNYSSFNDVTGIYTRKDIERDWDKTTWRAALDYQATPNNLVYGSVSTGFIAGGFAFAAPNLIYNPQLATAYEVGSKNAFGPRLQVNISGYYNQYRDLLANQFTTDPVTGAVFTYQINAGAVNSVGVEVEAQAAPTDPLRIGVTLALQNAKYGEFILGNPITPAYFPDGSLRGSNGYKVVGVTGTGSGAVMFIDLDGTQVALSPTTRLTIFASYDIKTGIGTFTPLVQSYMSSSYTSWDIKLGSDGVNVQDAYTRTDFRLIWGLPYAQWKVQAYVENIEDDAILLRGLRGGDNFIQAVYSAPRTAGVRLAYHFR